MTDETPTKPEPEKRPLSVLEETKAAIEELKKEREEMAKIRDELQQVRSDQLLSGTAGIRKEPEPPKPLTPKEYAKQLSKGVVPKDN